MKKRTAFIGAILSLFPFGEPLLIKTGVVLSTTVLITSLPEKVQARNNSYYFNRAYDKAEKGDHYRAISDYTKAIELDPKDADAYYNRGISKELIEDMKGACADWRKAYDLGVEDAANLLRDQC